MFVFIKNGAAKVLAVITNFAYCIMRIGSFILKSKRKGMNWQTRIIFRTGKETSVKESKKSMGSVRLFNEKK